MSEADTRSFPYEGRELRLVWDSSTGPIVISPAANTTLGSSTNNNNNNTNANSANSGSNSNSNAASAAPPVSPSVSVRSTAAGSYYPPSPAVALPPQPLPSGPPTPWPTVVKEVQTVGGPASNNGAGVSSSAFGSTATPVLACAVLKTPMNVKLQKDLAEIEPIYEEGEVQHQQAQAQATEDSSKEPSLSSSSSAAAAASTPTPSKQPSRMRIPLTKMNSFTKQSFTSSSDSSEAPPNTLPSRPKASLRTTSSNFIIRAEFSYTGASGFARVLSNASAVQMTSTRQPDRVSVAFWSQSKTLSWCQIPSDAAPLQTEAAESDAPPADAQPSCKVSLPKSHITFAVPITALAINHESASWAAMDLLVACGPDVFWIDPIHARYTRFNKAGAITTSPVVRLAWCPPARDQSLPTFLSAHADGSVVHFALDREDPNTPNIVQIPKADSNWNKTSNILAWTHPPQTSDSSSKKQSARSNPIIAWRCSKKRLTDLSVSPDPDHPGRFLAVTADDGVLRIIDLHQKKLLDSYQSYFGGLSCVSWSSDGAYCFTGGQDDLVSVYSPLEQRLVMRCQGHMSFVRSIAAERSFEDSARRLHNSLGASSSQHKNSPAFLKSQRFASVGEDARLVLWDLGGAAHHHRTASRLHQQGVATGTRRPSENQAPFTRLNLSSTLSLDHNAQQQLSRSKAAALATRTNIDPNELLHDSSSVEPSSSSFAVEDAEGDSHAYHEAPSRRDIPILKPVASAPVAKDILVELAFVPSGCVVLTKSGSLRVFLRPLPPPRC